jgi:hypothetical protein
MRDEVRGVSKEAAKHAGQTKECAELLKGRGPCHTTTPTSRHARITHKYILISFRRAQGFRSGIPWLGEHAYGTVGPRSARYHFLKQEQATPGNEAQGTQWVYTKV